MILATVKGQSLKINHPKVVADTIAYLEMSVQFKTEDWNGLTKYVHFSLGDEHYSFELVDDKITQDMHLDLPEGEWEIYIHGSEYQDGKPSQRITTEPTTLIVFRTGTLDGEPFPELSGSVGEQTIAKANEALEIAKRVEEMVSGGGSGGGSGENGATFTPYARIGEVELLSSKWIGSENLYSQVVNIEGVTENTQVDLTPSVQQLAVFYDKDLAFVTENEEGVVTVYCIGQKPQNDYTIQVTMTEVSA